MLPVVAPRPIYEGIEEFLLTEGEEGIITVQIHANPKPNLTWTLDHETIPEGNTDSTQRFQANRVQDTVCIHQFS
jgi:hypothetical protein